MKQWLAVLGIVLFAAVCAVAETRPGGPTGVPAAGPETARDEVPAPREAVTCGPLLQTAVYTAGGSTCAIAKTSLHGILAGAANCNCGFCSQQYVDQACMVIHGGYSVSGYLKYRCQICILEGSTPAPLAPAG